LQIYVVDESSVDGEEEKKERLLIKNPSTA
jgi:hypothetical protein